MTDNSHVSMDVVSPLPPFVTIVLDDRAKAQDYGPDGAEVLGKAYTVDGRLCTFVVDKVTLVDLLPAGQEKPAALLIPRHRIRHLDLFSQN